MSPEIPVITGPGDFEITVVGQRRRQFEFLKVLGGDDEIGETVVRAILSLDEPNEFDSRAVSVRVDGSLLGFLPMAIASDFRRAVVEGDLEAFSQFECAGMIWKCPAGTGYEYRISLDLPQDTPVAPPVAVPFVQYGENPHLIRAFRSESLIDRQIDELIGIVKGVTADGIVTQAEVEFLISWMDANRKAAELWPAKVLYPRLLNALSGGAMSIENESEILDLLIRTVGGNTATRDGHESDSTKLPYCGMDLPISFEGQNFCFTGVFASGTRNWCHQNVETRGGRSQGNITKKLHYLVVGNVGNENWLHSTHGRKIEKAVKYNDDGCRIAILSEEYWYSHL